MHRKVTLSKIFHFNQSGSDILSCDVIHDVRQGDTLCIVCTLFSGVVFASDWLSTVLSATYTVCMQNF